MDVGAVDVRHEVGAQSRVAEGRERLGDHRRAQIAAADPDVHDVGDLLVGPNPFGERRHRVEHGVHVGHHVPAVGLDHGPCRGTEGGVQHRPVLRHVDVFTGEHRLPALWHTGGLRPRHQRSEQPVVERLLRIVDPQVAGLDHVPVGSPRIVLEQLGE